MVSSTQQTSRIRRRKQSRNGRITKRANRANSTPAFPIHLTDTTENKSASTTEKKS